MMPSLLAVDPVGHHLVAALAVGAPVERRLMTWSPSMKVMSLTWPAAMYWFIWDVGDLVVPAAGREVLQGQEDADDGDDDPQPGTLENSLHKLFPARPGGHR